MDVHCDFPSLRSAFWSARGSRAEDASAPAAVAGAGSATEGLLLGSARTVREASDRDALAPGSLPPPPLAVLAEGWGGPPTPSGDFPGVCWAPPLPPGYAPGALEPGSISGGGRGCEDEVGCCDTVGAVSSGGLTASSLLPPLSSARLSREDRAPERSGRRGSEDLARSVGPSSAGSSVPPPPSARARSPLTVSDAFEADVSGGAVTARARSFPGTRDPGAPSVGVGQGETLSRPRPGAGAPDGASERGAGLCSVEDAAACGEGLSGSASAKPDLDDLEPDLSLGLGLGLGCFRALAPFRSPSKTPAASLAAGEAGGAPPAAPRNVSFASRPAPPRLGEARGSVGTGSADSSPFGAFGELPAVLPAGLPSSRAAAEAAVAAAGAAAAAAVAAAERGGNAVGVGLRSGSLPAPRVPFAAPPPPPLACVPSGSSVAARSLPSPPSSSTFPAWTASVRPAGAPCRPPALGIPEAFSVPPPPSCSPPFGHAHAFSSRELAGAGPMRLEGGMELRPLVQLDHHRRCSSPPASPTRAVGSMPPHGAGSRPGAPALPGSAGSPRSPSCPPAPGNGGRFARGSPAPGGLTRLDLDALEPRGGERGGAGGWIGRCGEGTGGGGAGRGFGPSGVGDDPRSSSSSSPSASASASASASSSSASLSFFPPAPPTELRARRDKLALWEGRCSEVAPGVFVGAEAVARDRATLDASGVTHVLSCVGELFPSHFPESKSYRVLCLRDAPTEDLLCVLYDALEYVRLALKGGGRVFVHCSQGVSRSVSLVVAWRMLGMREGYDAAFAAVKANRGIANPNIGFVCQLLQWSARRRAGVGRRGGRLYRLAPQGGRAPLHLVPKLLSAGIDERDEDDDDDDKGQNGRKTEEEEEEEEERGNDGKNGRGNGRGSVQRKAANARSPIGPSTETSASAERPTRQTADASPPPSSLSVPSHSLSPSPSPSPPQKDSGGASGASRASSSSSSPLPRAPKLARSLDPRGSFVLHSRRAAVAWVGRLASPAHARAAERAARLLARYEGAGPLERDETNGLDAEDGGVDARRLLEASGDPAGGSGADSPLGGEASGLSGLDSPTINGEASGLSGLDSPTINGEASGLSGLDSPTLGASASCALPARGGAPLPSPLATPPSPPAAAGCSPVPLPPVAPLPVLVVRQGSEPRWFWEALGARDEAQRAAAARAADEPVEAYDDELEAHARALAGARRAGGRAAQGAEDGLGGVDRGLPVDWTAHVHDGPQAHRGWAGTEEGKGGETPAAPLNARGEAPPEATPRDARMQPLSTCRGADLGRAPRWRDDDPEPETRSTSAQAAAPPRRDQQPSPPVSPTREAAARKTPRAAAPTGTPSPNDRQRKLLKAQDEASAAGEEPTDAMEGGA